MGGAGAYKPRRRPGLPEQAGLFRLIALRVVLKLRYSSDRAPHGPEGHRAVSKQSDRYPQIILKLTPMGDVIGILQKLSAGHNRNS